MVAAECRLARHAEEVFAANVEDTARQHQFGQAADQFAVFEQERRLHGNADVALIGDVAARCDGHIDRAVAQFGNRIGRFVGVDRVAAVV